MLISRYMSSLDSSEENIPKYIENLKETRLWDDPWVSVFQGNS